jgi:hypothetical protein
VQVAVEEGTRAVFWDSRKWIPGSKPKKMVGSSSMRNARMGSAKKHVRSLILHRRGWERIRVCCFVLSGSLRTVKRSMEHVALEGQAGAATNVRAATVDRAQRARDVQAGSSPGQAGAGQAGTAGALEGRPF